tara:strand:+ start:16443 stop:17348 length:906 start_codon:yes stop_codon:yes gene_type:complete
LSSQYQQDSFVESLFAHAGFPIRTLVESGCSFPDFHSNAQLFLQSHDCECFFIEGKMDCVAAWEEYISTNSLGEKVHILPEFIQYKPTGLSEALSRFTSLPIDFDVFFFDINGGEYQLLANQSKYRPKLICVEYDNAYPLCIEHVPQFFGCSPNYGQASSLSFFKLMEKLHYIYVRSFFQDHIFISQEFYESSRLSADKNFLVGRDAFLAFASDQLYDPIRVFANQKHNDCGKSFKFYSDKMDSLIFNGSIDSASVLFCYLSSMLSIAHQSIQQRRDEAYLTKFSALRNSFIDKYSSIIFS